MSERGQYTHWILSTDDDNILWLNFDKANASANTIDQHVLRELENILDNVTNNGIYTGLVIASKKVSGFIAGADVSQFTEFATTDDAFKLIRHGQLVLGKLEALKIPTVALIRGFCLGGGLELALACDYRIGIDDLSTRLGLPEVFLGIHPGWGGTIRLPRLIGLPALNLMLSGRVLSVSAAKHLGIVDFKVPMRFAATSARDVILGRVKVKRSRFMPTLCNLPLIRTLIGFYTKRLLSRSVNSSHYPAPFEALRCWQQNGVHSEKAFISEAESVTRLAFTDTSRQLVRDFFLKERLKGLAKVTAFSPKHVHVVGAGIMGGDIAAWCAYRGFTVTLQDRAPEFIAPAIKRAHDFYKKKLKKPRLVRDVMDRLMPDEQGRGIARADVIIEAIYENLPAKQALFKTLEIQAKPGALLASNTSSIPLDEIAAALRDPARLVGIHFFNPVAKMELVEVVCGQQTKETVVAQSMSFVGQLNRLPLPVKSSPGFLINRILMPYLIEAVFLLEEGIPASVIDRIAKGFGMPMGPVELADIVGLDICLSVANNLSKHFGNTVPESLARMVETGHLGRKSGKGFYRYTKQGKLLSDRASMAHHATSDIADRLILSILNESVACLRERIVEDDDLLDVGMIFGTGFAPFRGGPIQYAHDRGIHEIVTTLNALVAKHGDRFTPDKGWQSLQADEEPVSQNVSFVASDDE